MFKNLKFKYKIHLIPVAAMFGFVTVLFISFFYNAKNGDYLDQIGLGQIPALKMNRDLENALEDIQRTLQAGAASGELQQINAADTMYNRFMWITGTGEKNQALRNQDLEFIKRNMEEYYALAVDVGTQLISGAPDEQVVVMQREMTSTYNAIKETLQNNTTAGLRAMSSALESSRENNTRAKRSMIIITAVTLFLLGGGSTLMMSQIIKPIEELNRVLKDIAEGQGDLTKRINLDSDNEVGEMAKWFNLFIDKLHDIIERVKANTNQVAGAAAEISSAANQMAQGAEEQRAQSAEVASSVEEMTSSIILNSQHATETAKIAEGAGAEAKEGNRAMLGMRRDMQAIVQSSAKTATILKSLTKSAEQIGNVIEVIEQIADQTNLLALNAAIEAARVGEQGRGFAVVADEVRKLAERTTSSTKEIAETILAIQLGSQNASESMKEANTAISKGEAATTKTEEALSAIVVSVTDTMEMIQQIAASSEEQSTGAEEISSSVESIDTVTQETSLGAERMAAAAEELNSQAQVLKEVIDQFRLKDETA